VSSNKTTKADRWIKKSNNERLRNIQIAEDSSSDNLTIQELHAALDSLDANKAAGPDKLHAKLLKHTGPEMRSAILRLFNNSWFTAQVPQEWRKADIRPIPKKGKDPSLISSHRPISLTSCLGKVMEKVIAKRLYYHLETKKYITPHKQASAHNVALLTKSCASHKQSVTASSTDHANALF